MPTFHNCNALSKTRDLLKEITFGIQEPCNAQFVLGDVECIVQISDVVGRVQIVVVNEVGSVGMDQRIEAETVTPTCREIFYLNTFIPVTHPLTNESMFTIKKGKK